MSRRVQLGMRTRGALADKAGVSERLLGDIEKGRRGNYDQVTLVAVERALEWETGSIRAVLGGGEPILTDVPGTPTQHTSTAPSTTDGVVRAIRVILDSNLPDREKVEFARKLIEDGYPPVGELPHHAAS